MFGLFTSDENSPIKRYRLEVYSGKGPAVPYEICADGFHCRARLELGNGQVFYFFDDHQHQRGKELGVPEDTGEAKVAFLPTSLLSWALELAERDQLATTSLRGRKMIRLDR